jgi:hypothetical protein
LDAIYLMYFRWRLWTMYNLNYTPTSLGVQSWRELYLGVREQKRLNTTGLDDLNKPRLAPPQMSSKNVRRIGTLFWRSLIVCSSRNEINQISHPLRTMSKISFIFFHIWLFSQKQERRQKIVNWVVGCILEINLLLMSSWMHFWLFLPFLRIWSVTQFRMMIFKSTFGARHEATT